MVDFNAVLAAAGWRHLLLSEIRVSSKCCGLPISHHSFVLRILALFGNWHFNVPPSMKCVSNHLGLKTSLSILLKSLNLRSKQIHFVGDLCFGGKAAAVHASVASLKKELRESRSEAKRLRDHTQKLEKVNSFWDHHSLTFWIAPDLEVLWNSSAAIEGAHRVKANMMVFLMEDQLLRQWRDLGVKANRNRGLIGLPHALLSALLRYLILFTLQERFTVFSVKGSVPIFITNSR
ncbi:unnamed protein product [Linum trigynum]|uniref:Uncharacterized protein n=1 Tax=Linum trigynum TaxID=586398 RepID=A0AAV2G1F4_9ROSI